MPCMSLRAQMFTKYYYDVGLLLPFGSFSYIGPVCSYTYYIQNIFQLYDEGGCLQNLVLCLSITIRYR